jgi:hypothetical protein
LVAQLGNYKSNDDEDNSFDVWGWWDWKST